MSDHHNHGKNCSEAPPDPPVSNKNPVTGEDLPEGYEAVFEPNHFVYGDNEGIRHSIHLPAGTYRKAMKYYEEENWNELAKFPVWDNQQYTADDVILKGPDEDDVDDS